MADLITVQELAFALGLSSQWLRLEALAGRIPCLNAGGRLRFDLEAVRRALLVRAAAEGLNGPMLGGTEVVS